MVGSDKHSTLPQKAAAHVQKPDQKPKVNGELFEVINIHMLL